MEKHSDLTKIENERAKYKVSCNYCKHVLVFTPSNKKSKILCKVCGHYVYKNEKEKFKDLLNKERRKENACSLKR